MATKAYLAFCTKITRDLCKFNKTKHGLVNPKPVILPKGCATVVRVKYKRDAVATQQVVENVIFFLPHQHSRFLNKNKLFFHPGTYTRDHCMVNLLVSNLSDRDVCLPSGTCIGQALEAGVYSEKSPKHDQHA